MTFACAFSGGVFLAPRHQLWISALTVDYFTRNTANADSFAEFFGELWIDSETKCCWRIYVSCSGVPLNSLLNEGCNECQ